MTSDAGPEFPLIADAMPKVREGHRDDGVDIPGLRAAVDSPGLPYWSFDNMDRIPGRSMASGVTDKVVSEEQGAPMAFSPASRVAVDGLSGRSAPRPSSAPFSLFGGAFTTPSPSAAPMDSGKVPSAARQESGDDFAAFRAAPQVGIASVPMSASEARRMRLADMFRVLGGVATGRQAGSGLHDIFR
ncbi:hypothetical protein [Gluconacetobacter tumulicola]|uniref:Uncharacterized protein n=1 Tax=Gluconacetobacter tumulicola TaxID=1017177 RepID=A0A7W4P9Q2_9PROT|nr:hypothetical protein [Gluconacetobacter tumulicola]MBB2179250.1 hypothetical protein [Gluconacetobacter tumulicola]